MRARRAADTLQAALGMRHQVGRALVLRDLQAIVRMGALGAMARSGLADALQRPGTASDLAGRAGCSDVELTGALLELGVALREVRRRDDTYSLRGRRLRAIASAASPDVAGLAEEAVAYDGPIYSALADHLRGLPPQPYDAHLGDVIARASRVTELVSGPFVAATTRELSPARVLDVGCGTGVNLRWLADAAPGADIVGIDLAADALAGARENLGRWRLAHRVWVEQADLDALPSHLTEPWDLVLLASNIYYWPPSERAGVLARLRGLTGGAGTVLALTTVPARPAISRHLDLALRVTEGCSRLPTADELRADATAAGFASVEVRELVPGTGFVALTASR